MVSILVRKFNAYYAARPVLTTMVVNAVRCFHLQAPLGLSADQYTRSLVA